MAATSERSPAASAGAAWPAELERLDRLFEAWLARQPRRRERSPLAVQGAVIEDAEAEALLGELRRRRADGSRDVEPPPSPGALGLDQVAAAFGLSGFERDVLLLALAPEIDARYGRLIAFCNDHALRTRPTVGLVADLLGELGAAALPVFLPTSRLLRFELIALGDEGPLVARSLRLPDVVTARIAGWPSRASHGQLVDGPRPEELVLSSAVADPLRAAIARARAVDWQRVLVLVDGPRGSGRETVARAFAAGLGRRALLLGAAELEAAPAAVLREAVWHGAAVIARELEAPISAHALAQLDDLPSPIVITARESSPESLVPTTRREILRLRLTRPEPAVAAELWSRVLPAAERAPDLNVAEVAARFRFGPGRLHAAGGLARARARLDGDGPITRAHVDEVCRALPEVRLGALAQKLPCPRTRDALIVPHETRRELDLALAWARHGARVLEEWGLAAKAGGGLGLTCLFAGPPGTGKTLAAQVMAREIGLDLYRVDLSQTVSKYIGETEKNLSSLFDEARDANVILFFDEADALFGKRTEVRDAHDRYANVETGFLLQRLESHDGICILATNLRRNLDDAFLRRLHVVAEFPLPGPDERRRIWAAHLPDQRDGDVDVELLADRFNTSGGEIRNAVLTAAFLAADEERVIGMRHLVLGLWRELQKSGRIVDPSAFGPHREHLNAAKNRTVR